MNTLKLLTLLTALTAAAATTAGGTTATNTATAMTDAYLPNLAINDALSEPLQLVGRGILYGYDSIPSCLYKNSKALVVHGYCTRPESPAAEVTIYSKTYSQVVTVHAESPNNEKPISRTPPATYPQEFWYLTLQRLSEDFDPSMSFDTFKRFYKKHNERLDPYCVVSQRYRVCQNSMAEFAPDWLPAAIEFRTTPPAIWLETLRKLKSLVP